MNKKLLKILLIVCVAIISVITSCTNTKKPSAKEIEKLKLQYYEGLQIIYDKKNPFCPEAEVAFCDSVFAMNGVTQEQKRMGSFFKGINLLKLGDEKQSIQLLEPLVAYLENQNIVNDMSTEARSSLALAYLRLGERNNCINNHSSGSCIFPIEGKGVYTDHSFSEKAIDMYKKILQKDSTDLASRWLLNVAYMTIGEYPQKVPAQFLIKGLDTDTSSVKVKPFTDIAANLKLTKEKNEAGGSIVDDFNNDGYLDIITSNWDLDEGMHYFKNNADGTFTDVSDQSGLSKIKGGLNLIQADYNNDGYKDIFVLRGAWLGEFGKQPNSLLRNNGDGTFTDVTVESGLLSFHPTQTGVWADFNNDGWLDLFIGNETASPDFPHPSELYINNQDGTFTNVSKEAGVELTGFMKGVVSSDYNNDGWPDIFISRLDGGKILLKNKGIKSKIPQFENVTQQSGLSNDTTYTFPTWFWDYNNDGWPDIFVCGYDFQGFLSKVAAEDALNIPTGNASKMYLYKNNRDGTFTNVSKEVGLNRSIFAMGSNFGDIDNDGWLDMYLGTGNPDYRSLIPNKMFKNIDGKKFVDVTSSSRTGNLQKGHGVAFADIDNDGNQDIFVETGGAFKGDAYYNSFYKNPGQNDNNWISILLEGVQTNRSAIGAHIIVTFTENGIKRSVYRDVNSGGSFGCSPLQKEIGIGKATIIDELLIKWPTSGTQQVFKNIQPRQFIKIKEGINKIEKQDIKVLKFDLQNDPMKMMDGMHDKM